MPAKIAQRAMVPDGLAAGMLGAAAVAVWFLVLDVVQGRVFFTPAALGSALFLNATSPQEVVLSPAVVLGYTTLHIAAFAAAGLLVAALARAAERHPPVLLGAVLLFVTIEVFFLGMIALLANWLLAVLAWWPILVANALAAAVMAVYVWRAHPVLRALDWMELEEPEPFHTGSAPDPVSVRTPGSQ